MKKILALVLAAMMLFACTALAEDAKEQVQFDETLTLDMVYPEGYSVQHTLNDEGLLVWTMEGPDASKPNFALFLMPNEDYADLERINDLSQEELNELINSLIEDLNNPSVSVVETGLGSKVIIIDEQDAENDLIILSSIYHGYEVVMYIGRVDGATVTVADLQMAMKILTDMTFNFN